MLDSVSLSETHVVDCGAIIEIEAVGEIESGSSGNETANVLRSRTASIIQHELPDAVLFDFSNLSYEFGDAILTITLALHDSTTMTWRPGVILPSSASMPQFVSLLAASRLPMVRLAVSRADAMHQLESWLQEKRAARAESREFQRRMLNALIPVLEVRGSLPEWRHGHEIDELEDYWHTRFDEKGVPYYLAIGGAAALVRVEGHKVLVNPGDDYQAQSAMINESVQLIRSCLAGEDPAHLFEALRHKFDRGPVP